MCKNSKQTQTTNTSSMQATDLPDYVTQGGQNAVSYAQNLMQGGGYTPYTGDMVAEFGGDQINAFQNLRNMIASGGPTGGTAGTEAVAGARGYAAAPGQRIGYQGTFDQGDIFKYMSPYVEAAMAPAIRKIQEQSAQNRNRLRGGATAARSFGDARHGILESDVNANEQAAIGDTAARINYDAFKDAVGQKTVDLNRQAETERTNAGLAEQAIQRLLTGSGAVLDRQGGAQNQGLQLIQALLNQGNLQQGVDQLGLDKALEEYRRGQSGQYQGLEALLAALRAPHEQTVSSSGNSVTTTTKPDNSILGGLGSLGASLAGTKTGSAAIASLLSAV